MVDQKPGASQLFFDEGDTDLPETVNNLLQNSTPIDYKTAGRETLLDIIEILRHNGCFEARSIEGVGVMVWHHACGGWAVKVKEASVQSTLDWGISDPGGN